MLTLLRKKLSILILFLISALVGAFDPFGLDAGGVYSTSVIKILYYLPVLSWWIYVLLTPDDYGRKSEGEIKAEWIQKAKSLLRTVAQLLGMVVALNEVLNLNLTILLPISKAIEYISLNLDTAAASVGVVIGFALNVYSFFSNQERFEDRAGNPHQSKKLL
jgi:hypothetical protein